MQLNFCEMVRNELVSIGTNLSVVDPVNNAQRYSLKERYTHIKMAKII
jgi:hypothetical protein